MIEDFRDFTVDEFPYGFPVAKGRVQVGDLVILYMPWVDDSPRYGIVAHLGRYPSCKKATKDQCYEKPRCKGDRVWCVWAKNEYKDDRSGDISRSGRDIALELFEKSRLLPDSLHGDLHCIEEEHVIVIARLLLRTPML